jgi:hypothetical protein
MFAIQDRTDEIQVIGGIEKYNFGMIDYENLFSSMDSGVNVVVYLDATIVAALEQHGKNFKVIKAYPTYLVELNPVATSITPGDADTSVYPKTHKKDAGELVEWYEENTPEGVTENEWIDAVLLATEDGTKEVSVNMVARYLNPITIEKVDRRKKSGRQHYITELKPGQLFRYVGETREYEFISSEDGLKVKVAGGKSVSNHTKYSEYPIVLL